MTDDAAVRLAADVNHLLELLDLLPVPDLDDHPEFWKAFAQAHWSGFKTSYFVGKLSLWIERVDSDPANTTSAHQLAEYCLMFFDGGSPALWEVLDGAAVSATGSRSGRRLAESLSEAAWRVYVPLESAQRREDRPSRRRSDTIRQLRQGARRDDGG